MQQRVNLENICQEVGCDYLREFYCATHGEVYCITHTQTVHSVCETERILDKRELERYILNVKKSFNAIMTQVTFYNLESKVFGLKEEVSKYTNELNFLSKQVYEAVRDGDFLDYKQLCSEMKNFQNNLTQNDIFKEACMQALIRSSVNKNIPDNFQNIIANNEVKNDLVKAKQQLKLKYLKKFDEEYKQKL